MDRQILSFNNFPLICDAEIVSEQQDVSETVIKKAFAAAEEDFLSFVKKQWLSKLHMASVGSCCMVGVICNGLLYIANAGDSRAVLGGADRGTREAASVQLSTEYNANIESGIARRLVEAVLQEAAKKREMKHMDLKEIDRKRGQETFS
ncbi:hypothetical protein Peur_008153 [Populus x canadensis]